MTFDLLNVRRGSVAHGDVVCGKHSLEVNMALMLSLQQLQQQLIPFIFVPD